MFTGIVEELGEVRGAPDGQPARLVVAAATVLADVTVGDSVAVNGVCLTVVDARRHGGPSTSSPRRLARSTLGTPPRRATR